VDTNAEYPPLQRLHRRRAWDTLSIVLEAFASAVVAGLLLAAQSAKIAVPRYGYLFAIAVCLIAVARAIQRVARYLRRRLARRRATEAGYRICGACGFNLRGLDTSGVCPECGTAYSLEVLRAYWQA